MNETILIMKEWIMSMWRSQSKYDIIINYKIGNN